ncbi:MAG: DNA translocase FtsK [Eubacteriales bacterium]|nr:DNA translocase FtsK [Eubacteriales bacterium]MDY3332924.1 DNA translocase FtsK [Gallibacter sp.]
MANKKTNTKVNKKTASKKVSSKKNILKDKNVGNVDPNKIRIKDEIIAILLIALGIFLIMAMHTTLAGTIGNGVSTFLKGLFGLVAFLLPYLLIAFSVMMFVRISKPFTKKTVIFLCLIYIMLVFINTPRFLDNFKYFTEGQFLNIYDDAVNLNNSGIVGMYIGGVIALLIGKTGLYIFSIAILFISIIITMNTPFSTSYKNLKAKKENRLHKSKDKKLQENKTTGDQLEFEDNYFIHNPYEGKFKNRKSIISAWKNENNFGLKKKKENLKNTEKNIDVKKELDNFDNSVDMKKDYFDINVVDNSQYDLKIEDNSNEIKEKITADDVKKAVSSLKVETNTVVNEKYKLPPINLLNKPVNTAASKKGNDDDLRNNAILLEKTLKSFNVNASVINATKGSSVTRYELQPAVGVKVASIVRLADDIALNLKAKSIRIEAPIPGKAAIGIEVENATRQSVSMYEMINSKEFKEHTSKISFPIGKDISGNTVIADLAKMPHMLIAGATGSGKSVCINTIINSILYKATPDEVRLVLIDPKMVELGNYNGIPHLLIPVVTDSAKAAAALNWAVAEMTARYNKFSSNGVKNITSYNKMMKSQDKIEEVLPKIVIVIDELADLMMVASSQVEEAICRLAQLARAAGMHLIVATQRPSVDVVTGLIKANIPSRTAFMVSSQIDSRTIIDMPGAEKLVGNGDMLYKPQDLDKPIRVQGPFISEEEVAKVIEFVKQQNTSVEYNDDMIEKVERGNITASSDEDELMEDAIECVVKAGSASVSMLQRRFRIGYNRAARIVEDMEARGIVGKPDGQRSRMVLITEEELYGNSIEEEEE